VSARAPRRAAKLSRRRFVALAGASLAALSAGVPVGSAAAAAAATDPAPKTGVTRSKKPAAAHAPATLTAHQKEFERQKAGTLGALKTIRAYPLPPGGDLPVVFRPLRTPKKER
jgi:hypothetical protein